MKNIRFYSFLFILLTYHFFLYSQKSTSDTYTYNPLLSITTSNVDSLLYLGKIMQNSSDFCESQSGVLLQARGYYLNKNYNLAERMAKKILEETDCLIIECSIVNKINALNKLFNIKKNQNDYSKANEYLLKRERLIEKLTKNNHYILHVISIKRDKALLKSTIGKYEEAIYLLKSIKNKINSMYIDSKHPTYMNYLMQKISINNLLGDTHILFFDKTRNYSSLDSATICYKNAFDYLKEIEPYDKDSKVYFDFRMTRIFTKKKQYEKASHLLNKYNDSIKCLKTMNLNDVFYYYKFLIYNELNKEDSAFYYGKKYINIKNTKNIYSLAVYDTISEIYSKLDANDSAYYYSKKSTKIYKKIHKEINILKNQILQDKLNNDGNKDEILNRIKLKLKKYQMLLFSVLIIFALIVSFFLIKKNIKKSKKNHIIRINPRLEKKILIGLKQYEKTNFFLNKDTTLSLMAKELKTNTTYLSQIINKHEKKSFNQYLFDLRIDYLLRKLKEDRKFRKYTIKSLGEEIGYTNASAFTRAFKKYKNINPSDFLKQLKI